MTYQEKSFEKIQKALDKLTIGEAIETYNHVGEWLHKKVVENGKRIVEETEQQLQQLKFQPNGNEQI